MTRMFGHVVFIVEHATSSVPMIEESDAVLICLGPCTP